MASYLDMVTVLMCLFIVLFAMSSVDQQKFDALRAELAECASARAEQNLRAFSAGAAAAVRAPSAVAQRAG